MAEDRRAVMTGGCQCGAVRYAVFATPADPHICHCRMCQKAFGSFFAPLATVKTEDLAWTRGAPGLFASSAGVERGFCAACGTPLTFQYTGTDRISVSIGSLDSPADMAPVRQYGIEARAPWFDGLAALPALRTDEDDAPVPFERLKSRQHPDHDTDRWPPAG